jgi:D-glycero-D-manno-heptose 1,7-bisphosphate phosphatase
VKAGVFLDRDGVLIEEKNYLHRLEEVVFIEGAAQALSRLQEVDFELFVVTNQSGVGRGYFSLEDVDKVHAHLEAFYGRVGVRFRRFYVAPEAPDQPSRGRKPSPQFLFDARDECGIDLTRSYLVGDKMIDLECGWNAGVKRCLLVRTGYGARTEREQQPSLRDAAVVDDLVAAADWILRDQGLIR